MCLMTVYEAIPTNNPVQPFDSRYVLEQSFDNDKMLAKLKEIISDKH